VRGVGAGRSAARAPGEAPRSPARHARLHSSLAGNGLLPSPALSFPGRACAAGGTPHASGALRALHITRALCAQGARRSARQLARAGAWRRSDGKRRGSGKAPEGIFERAFGAIAEGASRSVLRFRARHLRFSSLRVLDPARGHGPRRAGSRAGGSMPARWSSTARQRPRADDRAEATHAHCQRFTAAAEGRHRQPRGLARRPRVRRVARARLRAQAHAPFIRAPRKALRRPRPGRARTARPRRFNRAFGSVKGRAQRGPEARGVPPRSEAQRDMKVPGPINAFIGKRVLQRACPMGGREGPAGTRAAPRPAPPAPLAGAAGGAVSPVVLSPVGFPCRRNRSREKRVVDSIAASFARRETRLPAFDFGRFIGVLPACRIAVRRAEEEI
jgi:hypothetical protein